MTDLYTYQFSLSFDPTVLQASSFTPGDFLGGAVTAGGAIDNSLGRVSLVYSTLVSGLPGVSGTGSLGSISFQAIGSGNSAITFSDLLVLTLNTTSRWRHKNGAVSRAQIELILDALAKNKQSVADAAVARELARTHQRLTLPPGRPQKERQQGQQPEQIRRQLQLIRNKGKGNGSN